MLEFCLHGDVHSERLCFRLQGARRWFFGTVTIRCFCVLVQIEQLLLQLHLHRAACCQSQSCVGRYLIGHKTVHLLYERIHTNSKHTNMPGLILGVLGRLEQQLESCADTSYSPDLLHRVWLAVSLVPVFAFVIVTYLSWTQRLPFYSILGVGIWVNSGIIWTLQQWIPPLDIPNTCVHSLKTRPADDAAALWLVFVYYYVYVLYKNKRLAFTDRMTWKLASIGMCAFLSSYALCYLELYTIPEVLLGSMIGAVSGIVLSVMLYLFIVPHYRHKWIQYFIDKTGLHPHSFDGTRFDKHVMQ